MFKSADGETVLPNEGCTDLSRFELLGAMLLKCLVDRRPVSVRFNPAVFKFLLDLKPSLADLELYSKDLARGAKFVLQSPTDLAESGLKYTTVCSPALFSASIMVCFQPDGKDVFPSVENRREWVHALCTNELVSKQERQLKALYKGFHILDLHVRVCLSLRCPIVFAAAQALFHQVQLHRSDVFLVRRGAH